MFVSGSSIGAKIYEPGLKWIPKTGFILISAGASLIPVIKISNVVVEVAPASSFII